MSDNEYGTVGWFEIGTDRPRDAERFYGEMFGWTFGADGSAGRPYQSVDTGGRGPAGGLFDTGGKAPNYAIFYVVVRDVAETLARAEALGAKTIVPATTTDGGLVFAHLQDPSGNHFGVFTPPPVR